MTSHKCSQSIVNSQRILVFAVFLMILLVSTCAVAQTAEYAEPRSEPTVDDAPKTEDQFPRMDKLEFQKLLNDETNRAKKNNDKKGYIVTLTQRTLPAELLAEFLTHRPSDFEPTSLYLDLSYVSGDLDLRNRELYRGLLAEACTFDRVLLDNAKSHEYLGFASSLLNGTLQATGAVFLEDVSFDRKCKIYEGADFTGAQFHGWADFSDTEFLEIEGIENTSVVFDKAVFSKQAVFNGAKFHSYLDFDSSVFQESVSFDKASFLGETTFDSTVFSEIASFRDLTIGEKITFTRNRFENVVVFDGAHQLENANKSELVFRGTTFRGKASFNQVNVPKIRFPVTDSELKEMHYSQTQLFSPLVCEQAVSFRGLRCDTADFTGADFRGFADFSGATFNQFAGFDEATFREPVIFYQTSFPQKKNNSYNPSFGLHMDYVRFMNPIQLEWSQIADGSLVAGDSNTWGALERTFKASGDLESQNQAFYQKRLHSKNNLSDFASRWFWGYGVRPFRLLFWILVVHLLFTFAYWTQTRPIALEIKEPLRAQLARLKFASDFSRHTALSWSFGYKNSRSVTFKALTLVNTILIKLMVILFLISLSNVSPLLRELFGKLIPA